MRALDPGLLSLIASWAAQRAPNLAKQLEAVVHVRTEDHRDAGYMLHFRAASPSLLSSEERKLVGAPPSCLSGAASLMTLDNVLSVQLWFDANGLANALEA